jgi:hypothetical protein
MRKLVETEIPAYSPSCVVLYISAPFPNQFTQSCVWRKTMNVRKPLLLASAALVLSAISLDIAHPAGPRKNRTTVADGTAPLPPLPRPKLAPEATVADGSGLLSPIAKGSAAQSA